LTPDEDSLLMTLEQPKHFLLRPLT